MTLWLRKRPAEVPPEVSLVDASGLFDVAFYQSRLGRSVSDPIAHYLTEGEAKGIPPSELFDPNFYRLTNPDVVDAGAALLLHYIRHGRNEGRYATWHALSLDAAKVKQSGMFSASAPSSPVWVIPGLPPVEQYLAGWRFGYRATHLFEEVFYLRVYPDAVSYGKPPIIHYLDVGQKQHRPANVQQLAEAAAPIQKHFDADYYRRQAGLAEGGGNPIGHYLTVGRFRGFDPSPDFSIAYYLNAYPDVAEAGAEPFAHWLRHSGEKRGCPDFEKSRFAARRSYNPDLPTLLVVNHDASRTGAPLVGLEIARALSQDHNVCVCCLREGELVAEFAKFSVHLNTGKANAADAEFLLRHLKDEFGLSAVILNSAQTSAFADAALYAGIASVALIHEFAEDTLPPGRMAKIVSAVDRAIVPAKLVFDSVQSNVEVHFGRRADNVVIRPQGCLPSLPGRSKASGTKDLTADEILALLKARPDKKPPIVLGAGFVQMRKGVELFVQAAQEVRRQYPDVRFIWVGAGYTPKSDSNYSVWLAENVRLLGLESTVFFLPPQSQLDVLFGLCDAFFLSSRLDPFPSVVLDALEAGKPVVCFDNATGAAELFRDGRANGAVVEYLNVGAAAEALVRCIKQNSPKAAKASQKLVAERFRFDDYVEFIKQQIEQAKISHAEISRVAARILVSEIFDNEFHEGRAVAPFDAAKPCLNYVSRGSKGLEKFNPRPGFNDGLYRSRTRIKSTEVPFDHALRRGKAGEIPATHRCVRLEAKPPLRALPYRIALHLHLFYPELADEFVDRLNAIALPIDLFVTTTDSTKRVAAEFAFSTYRHGPVSYLEVANRGRDIAPFLIELERPLAEGKYEIVGHLHSKRSLAVDAAMGERWRRYLLNTLLGDRFSHLLSLFISDPKLGLVFAEDRHAAGWNKNYETAKQLATRASPKITVPEYPYFPLGTMFWARPAALSSLRSLKLRHEDFPTEPLPNDGTILHAIERILPAACEAAGLDWCTVYDRRYAW